MPDLQSRVLRRWAGCVALIVAVPVVLASTSVALIEPAGTKARL